MKHAYLLALLIGTPAAAHHVPEHLLVQGCAPFDAVTVQMRERYGEIVRFVGLEKQGGLLVIYINAASETWTMFVISPQGCATELASGDAGNVLALMPEGTVN